MDLPPPLLVVRRARRGRQEVAAPTRAALAKLGHRQLQLLEVGHEVLGGLVAVEGFLAQAPRHDRIEVGQALGPNGRGQGRLRFDDARQRSAHGLIHEGVHAGRKLVDHHSQRKQIRPKIDVLAEHLLGCHIGRRADDDAGLRELRTGRRLHPGQAKVEDLDQAAGRLDDVLGLDVPVDDSRRVGGSERTGQLGADRHDLSDRQRAGGEHGAQRFARHVFAREVKGVADLLEGIDRRDSGVRKGRRGTSFESQPLPALRIATYLGGEGLERDAPSQPRVVGEVHHAHAAATELAPQDVRAHDLAFDAFRPIRHGRRRRRPVPLFEEVVGVRLQQRRHSGAQLGLAGAGTTQVLLALFRVALQSGCVDRAEPLRILASHGQRVPMLAELPRRQRIRPT